MHLITYASTYCPTDASVESVLEDIVRVSKVHNAKQNITGVLFYFNGIFLQIIEGNENALRDLMSDIEQDTRHKDVKYLIDTPIESRGFASWNMDSFILDNGSVFSADTLRDLTQSFSKNLLPRSDMLVTYYKVLLSQRVRA